MPNLLVSFIIFNLLFLGRETSHVPHESFSLFLLNHQTPLFSWHAHQLLRWTSTFVLFFPLHKCFHVTFFMYSTTTWLFSITLPRNSTIRFPVTCQVDRLWPFYCLTSLKTCSPDHVTSSLSLTAFQDSLMVHHF